ncbi:MAG: acyl-CoA thioesterase [Pirellulales bacterium]|nr:acyl-CoA thioesterase [Pirellulales bacterium]
MSHAPGIVSFRVRYADTDQMGTYYNARALEWFEFGRNELLRALGRPYRQWEAQGLRLPVFEAHVRFLGPAAYDDLLTLTTSLAREGRAKLRFESRIEQADGGEAVCEGWTVHAVTDPGGRAIRPPAWLIDLADGG